MCSMAFVSVVLFKKRKIFQERILAVFLIVKKQHVLGHVRIKQDFFLVKC